MLGIKYIPQIFWTFFHDYFFSTTKKRKLYCKTFDMKHVSNHCKHLLFLLISVVKMLFAPMFFFCSTTSIGHWEKLARSHIASQVSNSNSNTFHHHPQSFHQPPPLPSPSTSPPSLLRVTTQNRRVLCQHPTATLNAVATAAARAAVATAADSRHCRQPSVPLCRMAAQDDEVITTARSMCVSEQRNARDNTLSAPLEGHRNFFYFPLNMSTSLGFDTVHLQS